MISSRGIPIAWPLVVLLSLSLGAGAWYGQRELAEKERELDATELAHASSSAMLQSTLSAETARAESLAAENASLRAALGMEKERNDATDVRVAQLSATLTRLDKWSRTDDELLKKYSSTYFLNEHYVPTRLTALNPVFTARPEEAETIHENVKPYLDMLLRAATGNGLSLRVLSAFRSFGEQAALKNGYKVVYGAGTSNQFSADQGYSEHQLGTTVDFTTATLGGTLKEFEGTPEYAWLLEHAYRYGFTLSYPKGNAFFVFEPWHWRFVGVELATKLHTEGKHLYDLDQRVIDTYLVEIFD